MTRNNGLPQGWEKLLVGDLAVEINPGFPSGKHNQSEIGVPHLRPMNISATGNVDLSVVKYVETTGYDSLKEGDILFNNTNSPKLLGKTTYIPSDTNWAYSNHMTRIRVDRSKVLPAWLAHYLHFLFYTGFFSMNCTHHVNQASINTTFLSKNVEVPLPPLPEQERIVAKIEETFTQLEAGITELQNVKAQLKRYRAAVLKSAVEGELTREWRETHRRGTGLPLPQDGRNKGERKARPDDAGELLARVLSARREKWEAEGGNGKYKEPAAPNTDDLPELPEGWVWVSAEQVSDFITKGTTPKSHKLFSNEGDIPFIKVYNLTFDGTLDFSINPTFVSTKTHQKELARSCVYPDDVLMNIVGPPLGKVSIVPGLYPEWNMNQAIARFRTFPGFSNKFLSILLRSEIILGWARRRAKATAGQFNLTLQICRELPLPLPSMEEQQRIVNMVERRLSVADAIEKELDGALVRAERLRGAVLKSAFEGRLV